MKLSELKRLPIGTKLLLTNTSLGPVLADWQYREVVKVFPHMIKFKNDRTSLEFMYLHFPKNIKIIDNNDGFTVFDGERLIAQYKFIKN